MTNIEKYNSVFVDLFNVTNEDLSSLKYKQTPEWNSMAQIALVSKLEEIFDIDFDMDDIYNLTSYRIGKDLLTSKFNIAF